MPTRRHLILSYCLVDIQEEYLLYEWPLRKILIACVFFWNTDTDFPTSHMFASAANRSSSGLATCALIKYIFSLRSVLAELEAHRLLAWLSRGLWEICSLRS